MEMWNYITMRKNDKGTHAHDMCASTKERKNITSVNKTREKLHTINLSKKEIFSFNRLHIPIITSESLANSKLLDNLPMVSQQRRVMHIEKYILVVNLKRNKYLYL